MTTAIQPLVSCIMPTYNRRRFIPYAIRYFLRQGYDNKELIIIDDGTDNIRDLIPDEKSIRYFRLDHKITLGAKLNMACRYAAGNIVVHWDDDDWYSPSRIQYQVNTLLAEQKDLCGINHLLYYNLQTGDAYRYIYPPEQRVWLLGSSLCYTKDLWNKNQFADINVGMDGLFVWATSPDRIKVLPDSSFSVHMIHEANVSPKKTNGGWWHSYPVEEIRKIISTDWEYYSNKECPVAKGNIQLNGHTGKDDHAGIDHKTLKNVYACLVHENEDCITDLVRNLHYHDPASVILLYNGGNNPHLIKNSSSLEKYGAVICPGSKPAKHGYLHNFALGCMQFAAENFSYDTLTIVDSDQLSIRPAYTAYLSQSLHSVSDVGMLSSAPGKISRNNTSNYVAMQAFKEYDLWKPFIDSFPEGESKFVHWTFWPSTVFTADAIRDLIKLFTKNELLKQIMERSKIWATEEVILPTLVSLLGYKIIANPCSYEYVKYKKAFTTGDAIHALGKTDAYWIHPVPRRYDDPLRRYIRECAHQYVLPGHISHEEKPSADMYLTLSLLKKIRSIQGWLKDEEADLLITVTLKACISFPPQHTIVEVGSYHGKSTVLFGSVVKAFSPQAKVYAIDPHDGKQGAAEQGLRSVPPSFEALKKNIANEGLSATVNIIRSYSGSVTWQLPISLLFIDGLHDYASVSADFRHFAGWVQTGGYAVFHDYADYFPGVQAFVHELLAAGTYRKMYRVESLIVLQKLAT